MTGTQRYSAMNIGCPWRGVLPLADGNVGGGDRECLMFLYARTLQVITIIDGDTGAKRRRKPKRIEQPEPLLEAVFEDVVSEVPGLKWTPEDKEAVAADVRNFLDQHQRHAAEVTAHNARQKAIRDAAIAAELDDEETLFLLM